VGSWDPRPGLPWPPPNTSVPTACCRHRAELAAQREEERRAARSTRLAAKQQRVAAMEAERGAMLRALEGMRRNIRMQEKALKWVPTRGGRINAACCCLLAILFSSFLTNLPRWCTGAGTCCRWRAPAWPSPPCRACNGSWLTCS
jgi:hypothetical protein